MIQDLGNTLKAILTQPGLPPDLAGASVVFDRPVDPFTPTQTTVDLFLYDIRENLELRNNEPTVTTTGGMATTTPAPLRVACSYLVTAWPTTGPNLVFQEHQLLSEVLQLLSGYPLIPSTFLRGSLVGQQPPLPMVALQPDALKNMSEFWTSLGTKLRASLTVTVTIAMDVLRVPPPAPIVISQELGLEQLDLPATREATFRIAGTVTDATGSPTVGATVTIVERGLVVSTDARGNFSISPLAAGSYTLLVQSGAKQKTVSITVPATSGNYNVQLT